MKHILYAVLFAAVLSWTGCSVVNEEENPFTPVLTPGTAGTWDDYCVADPFVYYDSTDSKYKMYYAGCKSDMIYKIGYAESTDGIAWTKPNLGGGSNICLSVGFAAWANKALLSPCVVKNGTAYHMYFIAVDATDVYQAGYASSTDGLTWTPQTTVVLTPSGIADRFDEKHIRDIFVRLNGSTYEVWYTGVNDLAQCQLGYTTTTTANTITRVVAPISGLEPQGYYAGGLLAPHVLYDTTASTYRMWVSSFSTQMAVAAGHSSAPGTAWSVTVAPVLEDGDSGFDEYQVGLCAVIKNPAGAGYIMWYTGWSAEGIAIGRAVSSDTDGVTWTKYRLE